MEGGAVPSCLSHKEHIVQQLTGVVSMAFHGGGKRLPQTGLRDRESQSDPQACLTRRGAPHAGGNAGLVIEMPILL